MEEIKSSFKKTQQEVSNENNLKIPIKKIIKIFSQKLSRQLLKIEEILCEENSAQDKMKEQTMKFS